MFQLKRIYEPFHKDDGYRVLVDRLWPRGVKKEKAHVDLWLKDIAPTSELRTWFHQDFARWPQFQVQYLEELGGKASLIDQLIQLEKEHEVVTLLYASRDSQHNHALTLLRAINKRAGLSAS